MLIHKIIDSKIGNISVGLLCMTGILLLGRSLSMQPYENEARFSEALAEISYGQTEAYTAVREQLLTPKYALQDYGITLLIAAVFLFLVFRFGRRFFSSPLPPWLIAVLAAALPFVTVGGVVFDLVQDFERDVFPPWGDSLLIPLAGMPLLFVLILIWLAVHLFLFWPGRRLLTRPWTGASTMIGRAWLLLLTAVSAVVVCLAGAQGLYWFAVPAVLWILFYMALWRAPDGRLASAAAV